ncbi:MAG TPA: 30S ribosomal protein S7 [Patescibacteria group bacterium]|nr:30S ribosomal protein S7 [Patescibacteria group bacterium]
MRRQQARVRQLNPDPIYNDVLVSKLINRSMRDGKKSVAQTQIYKAFEIIKEQTKEDPMKIFHAAMENISPNMEVRPRRIGGAAYQVPMSVRGTRRETLAIRWLVTVARTKSNTEFHSFGEKMASELMDAYKGEGMAMKKKKDVENMAEANRAFAHFKW